MTASDRRKDGSGRHGESPDVVEYRKRRTQAERALKRSIAEHLLDKLENCWIDDLSISAFDALLSELKELKAKSADVHAAFERSRKQYELVNPGEKFPFRLPRAFDPQRTTKRSTTGRTKKKK